ncbi:FHA domain-containing protein [Plantactinospora sp. S1510]|uniref:FHA domain-containing protein n=1 Tax=Plantactinospora alkalitolerans TaxID=2789879 RepID=A0ABS0H9B9_9ACTN|nr:FHA domain-containing protein [Plantactinospora alkalitolerans]MBF9135070.1 FHA domain-containing protein [Plantactinospora alkalitolerans]
MSTTLLVGVPGEDPERRITVDGGPLRIGRDPLCGIVLDDSRASREHLELSYRAGRWYLRDLASRNGTFVNGQQVHELELTGACAVRLGNAVDGPVLTFRPDGLPAPPPTVTDSRQPGLLTEVRPSRYEPAAEPPSGARFALGRTPSASYRATDRIRIGRAPDNDIVLDDLLVSRYHADLVRDGSGFRVVDLGTRNGTYVNGRQVEHAVLYADDLLSFGHHQMVFDGATLHDYVDAGRVSLRAEGLWVMVGARNLLSGVSFDLDECSLLAVVGPSGAGKSTLLGALTGNRPAQSGTVRYQDRDLYAEYADLRHRIGLVPQDDILHRQLTVRRALRYAAGLRFGADVTPAERDQRIDEVLGQLALTAHADQRIDTLSGGQRKRTSVALELLTEPSLLFLDEPTSGLDPALDRDVMQGLRELADRGRTVVVVTHSPLHLSVCDRVLVLAAGGKVAYFGPPDRLLEFFGAADYADVFTAVAAEPDVWAAQFAATRPAAKAASPTERPATVAPPPRQGWWQQMAILTRRTVAVTLADRLYAALSLGLPVGLAALLHVVPGSDGLGLPAGEPGRSTEAAELLVILVIGAVFIGLAGGIREFVGEGAIYRRERAVGMAPGAYLSAKLSVFAVLNALQATLFVLLGTIGRSGPREALVLGLPLVELIVVIWLTTLAATVLGLLVSVYVSTSEQTMPVLVGLVMAQLVLCGGLFAVVERPGIEQLSWLAPARWGYAAAAATVDLRGIMLKPSTDALWTHTIGAWSWAMAVLAGQTILLTAAVRWALRRHEPALQSRRNRR